MASLATRRLIDAAATLEPADRALLNLWVNRGLGDERLTGLTGMSIDALRARREKIVTELAAELGLSGEDVRGALEQISPGDQALGPSRPNGAVDGAPSPNGAATAPVADVPSSPPAEPSSPPAEAPSRRRWLWLGIAALVVIVAAVIAIVAGGGSSPPAPRRVAATRVTTPAPTPTPTPTVATPAHPTVDPVPVPFAGLPGGRLRASGSVRLSGTLKHLKLNVTVSGLPTADAGHFEVWLYNSVIDSEPLGRLRNGHHRLRARLPRDVRHYRWIDISFQPLGVVNHSGESELRASNPAHTTMARLREHASRTRHRLRQAAKVSAAHPARPVQHDGRHRSRSSRHRALSHRLKRSANGSSRASTSK